MRRFSVDLVPNSFNPEFSFFPSKSFKFALFLQRREKSFCGNPTELFDIESKLIRSNFELIYF